MEEVNSFFPVIKLRQSENSTVREKKKNSQTQEEQGFLLENFVLNQTRYSYWESYSCEKVWPALETTEIS